MARNYTNIAPPIALTVQATTSSTTLTVASTTGYPDAPFTIGLERGTANEEVVLCTAKSSTTFTVTRGYDGTTARTHAIGTSVEHTVAAIDYRETVAHIESTGAHGVTTVAGLNEPQVLTNKTINGADNTVTGLPAAAVTSGVFATARIPQISYGSLGGIPTTFTPAAHTHDGGDLTGTINATKINGRTIYVQSSAPSSGVVNGDIWFQV